MNPHKMTLRTLILLREKIEILLLDQQVEACGSVSWFSYKGKYGCQSMSNKKESIWARGSNAGKKNYPKKSIRKVNRYKNFVFVALSVVTKAIFILS